MSKLETLNEKRDYAEEFLAESEVESESVWQVLFSSLNADTMQDYA
jgi:hypothetical protein